MRSSDCCVAVQAAWQCDLFKPFLLAVACSLPTQPLIPNIRFTPILCVFLRRCTCPILIPVRRKVICGFEIFNPKFSQMRPRETPWSLLGCMLSLLPSYGVFLTVPHMQYLAYDFLFERHVPYLKEISEFGSFCCKSAGIIMIDHQQYTHSSKR